MKKPNIILCILLDLIGYATYVIPGLGEIGDVIWAPVSAYIFYTLFGKKLGVFGGMFNFIEEVLPWTDFIPSFTIAWFIRNYTNTKTNS